MDALGGAARNLTFGIEMDGIKDPSWSPVDQRIAFARENRRLPFDDIGLLDAAGGEPQWFGLGPLVYTPSWSRDGSTLAYAGIIVVGGRKRGLAKSSGEARLVCQHPRSSGQPSWFKPLRQPRHQVHVLVEDGKDEHRTIIVAREEHVVVLAVGVE